MNATDKLAMVDDPDPVLAYKTRVLLNTLADNEYTLSTREQLFRDMVQVGTRELQPDCGAEEAFITALKVVLAICRYQSGDRFRVPGLTRLDAWARDLEIAQSFNGRNTIELARRFKTSEKTVESALRKHRRK